MIRQNADYVCIVVSRKKNHERDKIMNKNELIASVAEKCDMNKAQASEAVDAVLGSVQEQLCAGNEVRILGFGNFAVAQRKATTARNPRTGETVQVAASKAPKFKPGKALKEAVNS